MKILPPVNEIARGLISPGVATLQRSARARSTTAAACLSIVALMITWVAWPQISSLRSIVTASNTACSTLIRKPDSDGIQEVPCPALAFRKSIATSGNTAKRKEPLTKRNTALTAADLAIRPPAQANETLRASVWHRSDRPEAPTYRADGPAVAMSPITPGALTLDAVTPDAFHLQPR